MLATTFETLPLYFGFLAASVGLMVGAIGLYLLVTPYKEITLIRSGNSAAAVSLGGTAIGLAIALKSVAAGTYEVMDLVLWGGVALVCQIAVFLIVSIKLPGFREGIENDRIGYGITLGAFSVAMGILNAGSLTT